MRTSRAGKCLPCRARSTAVCRTAAMRLKDGAKLVESIDDVLAELGPLAENIQRDDGTTISSPAELLLNEIEQQVLSAIDGSPTSVDAVAKSSGLPIHRVLSTISVLEMRRLVRRVSGTQVVRA